MPGVYVCLDASDGSVEREVLAACGCDVRMLGATSAAQLRDGDLEAADVVAVWHTIEVDAALLRRLKRCRLVVRMGVGYDNVDVAAAGALGIAVANIPDYGTEEVADSALALLLGLFRGTLEGAALGARDVEVRGADGIAAAVPYVRRVRGATLGLLGLGRIGSAVAARAKACGFDVVFYDPHVADGYDKALGVRRADSLGALLAQSQGLSVHCNCAPRGAPPGAVAASAPERYLDAAALALLPRGALVVNTARGELVDEAALAAALRDGRVGAAALDVHAAEPYRAAASPLGAAPNCFHAPHSAWYSPESRREMREKGAAAALREIARAGPPRNVVNSRWLARGASVA